MAEALAIVAVGSALAGGGLKTFAARQQAQQQADNAEFAQREAEQNLEFQKGADAKEEMRIRRANRRKLASLRAQGGKSGIVQTQGSTLDFLTQAAFEMETDALNARLAGQLKQRQFAQQGMLARSAKKNIKREGRLNTAAGLLGTATGATGTAFNTGLVKL